MYGLGLLLYEMLAGHPAFRFQQRKEDDIREAVVQGIPEPLSRTDLAEELHHIVAQAVDRRPDQRQQNVVLFARLLRQKFGEVPAEKRRWRTFNRRVAALIVLLAIVAVVLILVVALIGS